MQPLKQPNFRIFPSPQKETSCPFAIIPIPTPHPEATVNLFPVPKDLPLLDFAYQCNPVICGLRKSNVGTPGWLSQISI